MRISAHVSRSVTLVKSLQSISFFLVFRAVKKDEVLQKKAS